MIIVGMAALIGIIVFALLIALIRRFRRAAPASCGRSPPSTPGNDNEALNNSLYTIPYLELSAADQPDDASQGSSVPDTSAPPEAVHVHQPDTGSCGPIGYDSTSSVDGGASAGTATVDCGSSSVDPGSSSASFDSSAGGVDFSSGGGVDMGGSGNW